jgi:hypothetical protein
MQRRLYFLFPNEVHAQDAIDHLQSDAGVKEMDIHVVTDFEPRTLRHPNSRIGIDEEARAESTLWNANLALFFIALFVFIGALAFNSTLIAAAMVVVMVATFFGGMLFTTRIPTAHMKQFREALSHGEILLMLDLPGNRVREVEHFVHTHYPDAVTGGVGWHLRAIGH